MIALASLLWFQEVDGLCEMRIMALPAGEVETPYVLPGSCEVLSLAPGPNGLMVLSGSWDNPEIWSFGGGDPTLIRDADGPVRHVGFSPDGEPLALVADYDHGQPFWTKTLALREGAWVEVETTSEDKQSVWDLDGGPVWQARASDNAMTAWRLESAESFTLTLANDLKPPRRVKAPEALAWGRVALPEGEIVVRYTMWAGPRPFGPVYLRSGRKWRLLSDQAFMETPASVQSSGDYRLISYQGTAPLVIDATTGQVVWQPDPDVWVTGALLR